MGFIVIQQNIPICLSHELKPGSLDLQANSSRLLLQGKAVEVNHIPRLCDRIMVVFQYDNSILPAKITFSSGNKWAST